MKKLIFILLCSSFALRAMDIDTFKQQAQEAKAKVNNIYLQTKGALPKETFQTTKLHSFVLTTAEKGICPDQLKSYIEKIHEIQATDLKTFLQEAQPALTNALYLLLPKAKL